MKKLALLTSPFLLFVLSPRAARAVEVTQLGDKDVTLDVTETSIVNQTFDARTAEGEDMRDYGWGSWINRLNVALNWDRFTLGTRLDSSLYWRRPVDQPLCPPGEKTACIPAAQQNNIVRDDSSRYRDSIYPAKIFGKYSSKTLDVTVGDAYVQFGRGLVLSLRKVDELAVDTTVRGGKLTWTNDPFSVTLVGGITNPTRIDDATGRALFLPKEVQADPSRRIQGDSFGPQPIFGSDRVIGAQIQAGRGSPIVLSTHGARFTRCAPYRYLPNGYVEAGAFDAPLGSCEPADNAIWLATVPKAVTPTIAASEIFLGGQSLEIPNLWGHGNLYVEAAVQKLRHDDAPNDPRANGNAVYGAMSTKTGPVTTTLEVKSYRNFYVVLGAVDQTRASAFSSVSYTIVPSGELITQDSAFGFFNACVNGGRLRSDVRVSPSVLLYAQGIYSFTKSEVTGGGCDQYGRTVSTTNAANTSNRVFDGLGGVELMFDSERSHFYASAGGRDDHKESGDFYYQEGHAEYTLTKHISGPYAVELAGRHRLRKEASSNIIVAAEGPEWWRQGEHYTALKIAPKWAISQGIEYTTQIGLPTYYFNGAVLYRFSSGTNIRLFGGQQRGGLKCVSGVCKVFPAYSGVRAELTVRF